MSFGKTAIDTGTDKLKERLPANYWTNPPDYQDYYDVSRTIGTLSAQEITLKRLVKKSTGEAKEELLDELAEVQAELEKAKAAKDFLYRHASLFESYLYAIGKLY